MFGDDHRSIHMPVPWGPAAPQNCDGCGDGQSLLPSPITVLRGNRVQGQAGATPAEHAEKAIDRQVGAKALPTGKGKEPKKGLFFAERLSDDVFVSAEVQLVVAGPPGAVSEHDGQERRCCFRP